MLLDNLDVTDFYVRKKQNWLRLVDILKGKATILTPENEAEVPFSLVVQCKSESVLNHYRQQLIEQKVYPAQLWPIPVEHRTTEYFFLSIHCDGRYSLEDMDELGRRMESLM
jgi:hypothetical protein